MLPAARMLLVVGLLATLMSPAQGQFVYGPPPGWNGDVGRLRIEPGPGMTLGHAGEGKGPGERSSDFNQFYSNHPGPGVHFAH